MGSACVGIIFTNDYHSYFDSSILGFDSSRLGLDSSRLGFYSSRLGFFVRFSYFFL
jgi:hypothetical protein